MKKNLLLIIAPLLLIIISIFAIKGFMSKPNTASENNIVSESKKDGKNKTSAASDNYNSDAEKLVLTINSNVFDGINNLLVYSIISSFNNLYPNTDEKNLSAAQNAAYKKLEEKRASLVNLIVPIYTDSFSPDEIKEIVAFLDTSAGKKFIETNPEILKEIQDVALDWGNEVSREITEAAIAYIPEAYVNQNDVPSDLKKDDTAAKK
ncbi:MAG: DUF2059 domain-containing protein [Alphaproteobacteria bacterium]